MDENEISCIYYPTTVVAVDDNETVLRNLELKIGKNIPCITFSDPYKALDFMKVQMERSDVLKNIIGVDEHSEQYSHISSQIPIQCDISKILQHVMNKDRFSEISVLVVDYAMPGLNGEELCKQLKRKKSNPIKIIMLTGEADEPTAIKLFNLGIIDKFFMKSQVDVHEALESAIVAMSKHYFYDVNYPLVRAISSDDDSALGDPEFITFFNKLCEDISASSYYLIETSGSFFLTDNASNPTWLIIRTIKELEEIADQIESQNSEELIDSIRKGEVVPYFVDSEVDYYDNPEKLKKSLYKAKLLKGKKDYAYAILKEAPFGFPLKADKIMSLDEYIRSM